MRRTQRVPQKVRLQELEKENEILKRRVATLESEVRHHSIASRAVEFLLSQRDAQSDDVFYVLTGKVRQKDGES